MMRFHPSAIGDLMSDAVSIDPALLTGELLTISRKKTKSDEEKAILLPLKQKTLSVGAKTALTNMAKELIFGYRKEVDTKQMQKGIMLEAAAIRMLGMLDFCRYEKNTERRTSDLLTGECDIYVPGVKTKDTKVSWDISTFPVTAEDAHDTGYEWQGRAYMHLWEVGQHDVEYLLLDTPEELLRWEQMDLHRVGHIDPRMRRTTCTYMRDAALEQKMLTKLTIAQVYLENLVDRILEEHFQPTRKPSMTTTAPDPAPQPQNELAEALTILAAQPPIVKVADVAPLTPDAPLPETPEAVRVEPDTAPTLRLGQISERLLFTVTADFLLSLGFAPAATEKNSKLFHEADFPRICAALQRHIAEVQAQF